jgi:hypothetical protein
MTSLIDPEVSFGDNADGLFIHQRQVISDDFLETLKSERLAKAAVRTGELNRVASVPTLVWEIWMKQGRDPHNASARQIVAWLEREDMHAFVTTNGRV